MDSSLKGDQLVLWSLVEVEGYSVTEIHIAQGSLVKKLQPLPQQVSLFFLLLLTAFSLKNIRYFPTPTPKCYEMVTK